MADKNFIVKNGFVVNNNLIWANNGQVGFNTSSPDANVTIVGTANVQGNVAITGTQQIANTIAVTGNATFSNSLVIVGNTLIQNSVSIVGNTLLQSSANVGSRLNVVNATTLSYTLDVANTAILQGPTIINAVATVTNNSFLNGPVVMSSTANVANAVNMQYTANVANTLGVTGATTLSNTLSVTGNVTLSNAVAITGNAILSNTLLVVGNTTFQNSALITGNTILSNTLSVTGNVSFSNSFFVAGFANLNNTLSVTNAVNMFFTANVANTLGVVGAVTLSNTLSATGSVTMSNTLSVTGAVNLNFTANVANTLGVVGATTLSNTLSVTGNSNLSNTLTVTGSTTLSNTLSVTGISTFSSNSLIGSNTNAVALQFSIANSTGNTIITPVSVNTTNIFGTLQTASQPLITSNNTSFVGTVTAANVVSNAQLSSNLANYTNTASMPALIAINTSNNASGFLAGVNAASYVTNTGNFTLAGVIGHTGNVYVNAAFIANGSAGASGQVLQSNGSSIFWGQANGSSVGAGGTNTQIQFNTNGALDGNANLTFDKALSLLTVGGSVNVTTNTFTIGGSHYYVSNGNVGFGTSTPSYRVQLNVSKNTADGIAVRSTSTNATAQAVLSIATQGATGLSVGQKYTDNSAFITLADAAALTVSTNNVQRIYIAANGNIGLNTGSAPTVALDLATGQVNAAAYNVGTSLIANSGGIYFGSSASYITSSNYTGTANNASFLGGLANTSYITTTTLSANALGLNGSTWYFANSTNGFGINGTSYNITQYTINQNLGTTNSPTYAGMTLTGNLTVNADIYATRSGGNTGVIYLGNTAARYVYYDGAAYQMPGAELNVNNNRVLNAGNFTSYSPNTTGGSASGTWGISITGNAATVGGYTPSVTAGTASRVVLADSNGYIFNNYFNSTDNSVTTGVTAVMVKTGTDNYLRSGTAAAVSAFLAGQSFSNLQISSLGVGTAASGIAGEIRATNNITAYYSDERLKTEITTIKNALEKVKQISGVTYIGNDVAEKYGYTDKSEQVGVLAQQIEKVLPHVVKHAPFDIEVVDGKEVSKSGQYFKTVQYEKIIPLLIEAIKDLSDKIDSIEERLK